MQDEDGRVEYDLDDDHIDALLKAFEAIRKAQSYANGPGVGWQLHAALAYIADKLHKAKLRASLKPLTEALEEAQLPIGNSTPVTPDEHRWRVHHWTDDLTRYQRDDYVLAAVDREPHSTAREVAEQLADDLDCFVGVDNVRSCLYRLEAAGEVERTGESWRNRTRWRWSRRRSELTGPIADLDQQFGSETA